jgi:hypothetical protein
MAGKPKDTVSYFPHYVNDGRTVYILEKRYGDKGYAFWFRLLELLCKTDGHFYTCKDEIDMLKMVETTCRDGETTCKNLIFTNEVIEVLVDRCKIDRDLWEQNRIIWCQNLVDNLADVYRNRRRSVPDKPKLHVEMAIPTRQRRGEERKGKERKDIVTPKKASRTHPWKDSKEKASCQEFVKYCRKSKSRHVRLIGEWADEIKPDFITRGQWWLFFEQNLRGAKKLANYTDDQISDGYGRMESANYLTKKQNMETLFKYTIDQTKGGTGYGH